MNTTFRTATFALFPVFLAGAGCSLASQSRDEGATQTAALSRTRERKGEVFTQTNAAVRNELVAFARGDDGTLTPDGRFDTGGAGLGTGVAAQGAIAGSDHWLFVVNAGSNDVSTFDLRSDPPTLASRTPSGGTQPVSVTAHDHLVYVLNAAGAGNISGFQVDEHGMIDPVATRPLSGENVVPTQVAFAPDGDTLVVTEKATNLIDTYFVDDDGRADGPTITPSNGPAPFGFDFTPRGELIVSEAAQSAASAYAVQGEVHLASISTSIQNGQSAACWVVATPDGEHAFTSNTGSGTLSSYRIGGDGALTLESGAAGSTGPESHPIDIALAAFGTFLFALADGAGTITAFRVDGGELTSVGTVDSIPPSATGLIAR
jgi:6-phosphogluconolactonase (cycloisomerase 2 family)